MERIDDLQYKGLHLIQDTDLFCFGTDAVLLADFAVVPKRARVVDLGAGTGIIPVLLFGRQPQAEYRMIEIQPRLYELAVRNIALNGMEQCAQAVLGDIKDAYRLLGGGYDVVVANPPYEKNGDGAARQSECHRIARKEAAVDFEGICSAAGKLLKSGGKIYLIHKAARLAELLFKLKTHRLEPKILRMVQPREHMEPKYALIGAAKDAGEGIRVLPPLVIYGSDGEETEEVRGIYHRGQKE